MTGKPKVHLRGDKNPNHGNAILSDPIVHTKFLSAVKARGQAWTAADRKRHSMAMKGRANAMRGMKHSAQTKADMSAKQVQRHQQGINFNRRLPMAERRIQHWLTGKGIHFVPQFHIPGESYLYDFYFPALNLIVEYQGDYWHGNPAKYKSGHVMRVVGVGPVLVDAIWAKDALKKATAEKHGYRVKLLWESDFKKDGFVALERLLQ